MDKKYLKIAIVALAILTIFLMARSCKLSPKVNRLQGEIALRDELIAKGSEALKASDKSLRDAEKAHSKKIGELNGMIDSSNTVIARLGESDKAKAKRIRDLEATLPNLNTVEEQIAYYTTWGQEWKDRFSLCQQTVGEKDKIIFSLTQKYEAEFQLRLQTEELIGDYKSQLSLSTQQLQTQGNLVTKLERKLRWNKSLKTGTVVALVGTVAYLVLRK